MKKYQIGQFVVTSAEIELVMIKLKDERNFLEIALQKYSQLHKQSHSIRTVSIKDQEISDLIYQISLRINQVNREINRLTNQKELSEATKLDETQTEISDEEIVKGAKEWYEKEGAYKPSEIAIKTWGYAIKWYKEQLKKKL